MITRRDLFVALIAIVGTAGAFAIADQGPVMGPVFSIGIQFQ
jgi:hypothetical protein